jgi:glycosyltransferase involved in cell wall biosynthesis
MNVGIVTYWFERGAAYVSRQYRDAWKQGHDVFIYARGGEGYAQGDPRWDDATVTWSPRVTIPISSFIDLRHFKRWILKNKIDVVFFNEQWWWAPVLLCRELGVVTGSYVDYYNEETMPLFGLFDFLVCNTRRHHEAFSWHRNAFYIPWGTDVSVFKPKTFDPVTPGFVTFFHSCGYDPIRKNTGLVIEAFARLDHRQSRLVIHSQLSLRKLLPKQAGLIDKLEQAGFLTVIEKSVSAPGLFHLGDVYVYPAKLEGIGLTIAEAMACGLPAIVPDNPPMNEFVMHESSGRLVKIDRLYARADGYYWPLCAVNQDDLVRQMNVYIEQRQQIPELKRKTREYAEAHLSWGLSQKALLELLRNVKRTIPADENELLSLVDQKESWSDYIHARLYRYFKYVYYVYHWLRELVKYLVKNIVLKGR